MLPNLGMDLIDLSANTRMIGILHMLFELEIRKRDAAVRKIRETPTFAHSDLCDCVPLIAYQNLI
jgi:hypothetical protein